MSTEPKKQSRPKKRTTAETVFEMNSDIAQQFGAAIDRQPTTVHQTLLVQLGTMRQIGVLAYAVAHVADALRSRRR